MSGAGALPFGRLDVAPHLTPAQLQELRERLERERLRILRLFAQLSPPVTHADRGFTAGDEELRRLREIDRALAKMRAGDFGWGEVTRTPIPYDRLVVEPWLRDLGAA
jgi:RNA polymerase-binding transcription factor DksA